MKKVRFTSLEDMTIESATLLINILKRNDIDILVEDGKLYCIA